MKNAETLLKNGLEALGLNDSRIYSLFCAYIKEIELFNPAYGLVGVTNSEELIIKHILDSLAPLGIISRLLESLNCPTPALQIADAGSGAGLPGIPLAIAMMNLPSGKPCNFSLIERMGRRAGFLCNTKAVLSLSNITVEECELEKAAPGCFDLVTFRAFKPIEPKLLKSLFKTCSREGFIAAYKGKMEKIKEEMSALYTQQKETIQWEAIPYSVPFLDEQRHLLVIRRKN